MFTAGPPGSGKTTWLRQNAPMLLDAVSIRIDPYAVPSSEGAVEEQQPPEGYRLGRTEP